MRATGEKPDPVGPLGMAGTRSENQDLARVNMEPDAPVPAPREVAAPVEPPGLEAGAAARNASVTRWMTARDRGWNRAWHALHERRGADPGWQYMGTEAEEHVFRLREGDPRYERIAVAADDFEPVGTADSSCAVPDTNRAEVWFKRFGWKYAAGQPLIPDLASAFADVRRETIEACLFACDEEIASYDSGTAPEFTRGVEGAASRIHALLKGGVT